ncbi:MAG: 50S ribosomal protein L18 [Patescibacteria group bacterium]
MKNSQKSKRTIRHRRVRSTIKGTKDRPRLSVYRSSKYIFVQLVDDNAQKTIIGLSDKAIKISKKMTKSDRALALGKLLAEKAILKKFKKVVFDRGGYRYQGRVQKVAEGARSGGLEF